MCVFLSFATEGFLTSTNLLNVGRQISLLGIMAVGMTFVLISGEVDLSVGSIYALGGLVTGLYIVSGGALLPALALGLASGLFVGLINGLLSTYGRLPSLIATPRHALDGPRRGADPDRWAAGHRQREKGGRSPTRSPRSSSSDRATCSARCRCSWRSSS